MNIKKFAQLLGQEKASAILRTDNQAKAALAMEAAIRGGSDRGGGRARRLDFG